MANQYNTNGYQVFTNGSVLAFYAARYNNNVGNIIGSETYNWQYAQDTQSWIVNGTVQNIYIQFGNNNSIRWYGYWQGGIGGSNSTFDISWDNIIVDDLTHHYYFHIARSGDGFANRSTVSLYIDGRFISSKTVGSSLGHDAWFNIPIGIGADTSGFGERKTVTTGDGTYYRSYGEWQTPDIALGLIGQLWFGYGFATPELGLNNLWRNGYVDLGEDGKSGAVTQIQPQFYNSFGYAGAGYTARTGLASNFQLQPGLTRRRTATSEMVARATVRATGRNNADYLARLLVTARVIADGGFQRTLASAVTSASQLTTANTRNRTAQAPLESKFTISADLRKTGINVQAESNFTINCTAQKRTNSQLDLQVRAQQLAVASRLARTGAQLTTQVSTEIRAGLRRTGSANLQAFDQINVNARYHANFSAFLTARTALSVNIADYKLNSAFALTATGQYNAKGVSSLIARVTVSVPGNYNTHAGASLQSRIQLSAVAQSRAKDLNALRITSETRRLSIHKETRTFEVASESRLLDVLNT
jgi:hypothetical protein